MFVAAGGGCARFVRRIRAEECGARALLTPGQARNRRPGRAAQTTVLVEAFASLATASHLASCTSRVLGYPQRHRCLACEVAKSALRGLAPRRIRQNGVKLTGTHPPSSPSRDVVRALPSPVKCLPIAWRGGRLQSTELAALPLCSGGWAILTFRCWCSCLPGRAEWTPWAQA
ncbi:hypothetical protein VTO73DRAFT_12313 [Trametes versicolor]